MRRDLGYFGIFTILLACILSGCSTSTDVGAPIEIAPVPDFARECGLDIDSIAIYNKAENHLFYKLLFGESTKDFLGFHRLQFSWLGREYHIAQSSTLDDEGGMVVARQLPGRAGMFLTGNMSNINKVLRAQHLRLNEMSDSEVISLAKDVIDLERNRYDQMSILKSAYDIPKLLGYCHGPNADDEKTYVRKLGVAIVPPRLERSRDSAQVTLFILREFELIKRDVRISSDCASEFDDTMIFKSVPDDSPDDMK